MSDEDHYFYDSNGEMWVNVSACRTRGNISLHPLEGYGVPAEVYLDLDEIRVGKEHPELQLSLTTEDHNKLGEFDRVR